MSYAERKRFRGVGSGDGGLERPTFEVGVNDGRVSIIAAYGGGPFGLVDLHDDEFRERIDIYARCHDLFRGGDSSTGRDDAIRSLIEIGLKRCDEAKIIDRAIAKSQFLS
jgi:hypothetical protein